MKLDILSIIMFPIKDYIPKSVKKSPPWTKLYDRSKQCLSPTGSDTRLIDNCICPPIRCYS
jgi:hypothetical protein